MENIYICTIISKKEQRLNRKIISSLKNLKNLKAINLKFIILINGLNSFEIPLNKKKFIFIKSVKKKIPEARNLILKKLRSLNFDYAGFVDDDCFFKTDWMIDHLSFLKSHKKVHIVSGPQLSYPKSLFHKLLEPNFKHNQNLKWCPTNNVFFKSSILKRTKYIFDEKLNNIGGSDQLFFLQINNAGFKIIWNKKNPVYEYQNKDRLKFKWFVNRNIRYGYSGYFIDKKAFGTFIGTACSISKFFYYLVCSCCNLLLSPFNFKIYLLTSIQYLARSLGRIKAFFFKHDKYV